MFIFQHSRSEHSPFGAFSKAKILYLPMAIPSNLMVKQGNFSGNIRLEICRFGVEFRLLFIPCTWEISEAFCSKFSTLSLALHPVYFPLLAFCCGVVERKGQLITVLSPPQSNECTIIPQKPLQQYYSRRVAKL